MTEEQPEAEVPKLPRCCMGATYWSQSRFAAQQPPVSHHLHELYPLQQPCPYMAVQHSV